MALKIDYADREILLELDPTAFYLTDHYRPYPAILVRLSEVPVGLVTQILEKAWRFQAPKSLSTSGERRRKSARQPAQPRRKGGSRTRGS